MAYTRQCDRCKRLVAPRGRSTPRFCPVCGARLTGGPVQPLNRIVRDQARSPGQAVVSLICGILSLPVPVCGLPLGLIAIGCGLAAKQRINRSPDRFGGGGLATAGITLGIVGSILHLLVCLGMV